VQIVLYFLPAFERNTILNERETHTMATTIPGGTAKIYQFRVGGRASSAARNAAASQASVHDLKRAPTFACNGSWYHDAAIAEADTSERR
jgi:hypothetical protein